MSASPLLQFPLLASSPSADILTKSEEDAFRQYLADNCSFENGLLIIGDAVFDAFDILKEMDPQAFANSLVAFRDERLGQLARLVTEAFPGPIAYCFHMYVNGADNEHQRLQFLRDSWEALARFVHALVVSEARHRKMDLQKSGISFSDLFSDRIAQILDNIEAILTYAAEEGEDLVSFRVLGPSFVEKLRRLNHLRNGFSHSNTLSAQQTSDLIDDSIEEFIPLLWSLEELRDTHLLRVISMDGNSLRLERYVGYAQVRRTGSMIVSNETMLEAFAQPIPFFRSDHLLVSRDDQFFCLSLFIHFRTDSSGHHTRILLLKKRMTVEEEPRFVFDVIGESQEISIARAQFSLHVNDLRACFGLGAEN